MDSFGDVEQKYQNLLVNLDMRGKSGSGKLTLAGGKTELTLITQEHYNFEVDERGWFDLFLKTSNENRIFLHNAVHQSRSWRRDNVEYSIYPNFVALEAEHLTKDGKASEISFTLKNLRSFFSYDAIEWQSLRHMTPSIREALRDVRRLERRYPRDYEFFRPRELYIVHQLPRILKIEANNCRYEVKLFTYFSNGAELGDQVVPVATITFRQPMNLTDAVQKAWDWRRFFTQIAMEPLPFESFWVRAKGRPRGLSQLYLPGLRDQNSEKGPQEFHKGNAPFSRWNERKPLAQSMKVWLEKQPERRQFRVNLESVINERNRSTSPSQILQLAAGIESLTKLASPTQYTKKEVERLANGAIAAANQADIVIDEGRIKGLLGNLRRRSLAERLDELGKKLGCSLPGNYNSVIGPFLDIRNSTAHGGNGVEQHWPKISAIVSAVTAMCVMWDLSTCGIQFGDQDGYSKPEEVAALAFRAMDDTRPKQL